MRDNLEQARRADDLLAVLEKHAPSLGRALREAWALNLTPEVIRRVAALLAQKMVAEAVSLVMEGAAPLVLAETQEILRNVFVSASQWAWAFDYPKLPVTRFRVKFNQYNPEFGQQLIRNEMRFVQQINEETRAGLMAKLEDGLKRGLGPREIARGLRDEAGFGLTESQEATVARYRKYLSNVHEKRSIKELGIGNAKLRNVDPVTGRPVDGIDRYRLRDRRFDRTIAAANRNRKALTPEQIEKQVQAYRRQMLRERSDVIARTETIQAGNRGVRESWRQMVQSGVYPNGVLRYWYTAKDEAICPYCRAMAALNKNGRGLDEPFIDRNGEPVDGPPGHPQCRCVVFMRPAPKRTITVKLFHEIIAKASKRAKRRLQQFQTQRRNARRLERNGNASGASTAKEVGRSFDAVMKAEKSQYRIGKHPNSHRGKGRDDLPAKPGTLPIPEGHVRLYHQTNPENIESIRRNGLSMKHARGIEGPRAIYAGEKGFYGDPGDIPTIEFSIPKDKWREPFVGMDSVPVKNILAIHLPWHSKARYIERHKDIVHQVVAGEFDDLIARHREIGYIKNKYNPLIAKSFDDIWKWDESKHPRQKDGKFGVKSGVGAGYTKDGDVWKGKDGKLAPAGFAERVKALKVPPKWRDVRVNPDQTAGLQAVGFDSKNRPTALYSKEFHEANAAKKFARLKKFTAVRDKLVEKAHGDSSANDDAAAVVLIAHTGMRVGSTRSTGAKVQAYGATTLQARHVSFTDGGAQLKFVGKKGVYIELAVEEPSVVKMLAQKVRGKKGEDHLFNTSDSRVRDYLHGIGGKGFMVKDFRTHVATSTALSLVKKAKPAKTDKEYKTLRTSVAKRVSSLLGNTPAMALSSYIDPAVWHKVHPLRTS